VEAYEILCEPFQDQSEDPAKDRSATERERTRFRFESTAIKNLSTFATVILFWRVVSLILHDATAQIPLDYWIAEIPIEKGQRAQPRS